jgi:hypothetical protein
VRVIVMAAEPAKPPRYRTYGKYPGEQSTLEDFKVAEWHGEAKHNFETL